MRKVKLLLVLLMGVLFASGQVPNQITGRRVAAMDSVYLNGAWVKKIATDTSESTLEATAKLPNMKVVRQILDKIAGIGAGSGDVTNALNVGFGYGLFKGKAGSVLELKTIRTDTNFTMFNNTNDLEFRMDLSRMASVNRLKDTSAVLRALIASLVGGGGIQTLYNFPATSSLRTAVASTNNLYFISNKNASSFFYYDPTDLTTVDDSVMTIVGVAGARFKRIPVMETIDVRWFGAIPNDGLDDYAAIQRAIDYAVKTNTKRIFIPGGSFLLSKGLLVWKDANNDGTPEFVNLTIEGVQKAYMGYGQGETELIVTNKDNFGLAIMKGKGCLVRNLNITGTNLLYYPIATGWNPASTYVKTTERTNVLSPYAGIVVDPFHSLTTGSDRYPGFESYYAGVTSNSGSTDCRFENIVINGFVVGFICTPAYLNQNNEAHVIDGMWLTNCREGIATTNSQERQMVVKNIRAWDCVQTVFDTYTYGAHRGEVPNIDGVNAAGGIYQLFRFNGYGGYFPAISVRNVYAELFYRIGDVIGVTVSFENCHFAFGQPNDYGLKVQNNLMWTIGANFQNCILIYYNACCVVPMNFKLDSYGRVRFEKCVLTTPIAAMWNQWTEAPINIKYEDCAFYPRGGVTTATSFKTLFNNSYVMNGPSSGGTRYLSPGEEFVISARPGTISSELSSQSRRVRSQMQRYIALGNVTITVSGLTATANIPSLAGKNDYFANKLVGDQSTDASTGTQMMRIQSVDSLGNVVFDYLTERVTSGTYYLSVEDLQYYEIPTLFNSTAGILSAYQHEGYGSTQPLVKNKLYIHRGYPVIFDSVNTQYGRMATAWKPYEGTISRGILSNYEYDEYGYTYGSPDASYFLAGQLFTEGAVYTNTKKTGVDSNIVAYKVTMSGVLGSPLPPTFAPIYRNSGGASQGVSLGTNGDVQLGGDITVARDINILTSSQPLKIRNPNSNTNTLLSSIRSSTGDSAVLVIGHNGAGNTNPTIRAIGQNSAGTNYSLYQIQKSVNNFIQSMSTGDSTGKNTSFALYPDRLQISLNNSNMFLSSASTGNFGLFVDTPRTRFHFNTSTAGNPVSGIPNYGQFLLTGTSDAFITIFGADAAAGNQPGLVLARAKGTPAAPATVVNGDLLGSLIGAGFDGVNAQTGAGVEFFADSVVWSNNVPTKIALRTGTFGGNRLERLTVRSNGRVGINNTAPGYRFDVNGDGNFTQTLRLAGAAASLAPLNIPIGTVPSSPALGDLYFDPSDTSFKYRVGVNNIPWKFSKDNVFGSGLLVKFGAGLTPDTVGVGGGAVDQIPVGNGTTSFINWKNPTAVFTNVQFNTIGTDASSFTAEAGTFYSLADLTGTANATITLPSAAANAGKQIIILNQSVDATFKWSYGSSITLPNGTTRTTFADQTLDILMSNGSNWIKIN